ncbi:hypothetical protein BDR22DRAFT_926324 [Usnea florida]
MIQKPYVLADIQQDLTGLPRSIYSTDVFAITGSKKRKRSELALAIDRQGIDIYDVQLSKLITSYAISPQAVFTCPPCSIRLRRLGDEPARRYTYCSVTSPKPQLLCFSESPNAKITTSSISLRKETTPVLHLDTFETGSGSKVLALHRDGTVTSYSKGLDNEEWHSSINAGGSKSVSEQPIQATAILSLQQARKTILKNREDILITLGTLDDAIDLSLLLVMVRAPSKDANSNSGTLELRIFSIRSPGSDTDGLAIGAGRKLQLLVTLAMPEPSFFMSKQSQITIHPASGTIHQEAEGTLAVYDLTGSVPRIAHTLVRNDAYSYLRLSPELIASSRGASLSILDLQYGSLQAEGSLTLNRDIDTDQALKKLKHKRTTTENVRLLSYFAPLDVMVALDGPKLLAIQLVTSQKFGGSRKRKRDGLLVNSIGRGISSMSGAPPSAGEPDGEHISRGTNLPSSDRQNMKVQEAALDRCLAQDDIKEFERLMAAAQEIKTYQQDERNPVSGGRNHVDQQAVSYVLKAMFSVDQISSRFDLGGEKAMNLSIRIYPPNIGRWFIDRGLVTSSHVEMSLKKYQDLSVTSKLATGALVRALAKLDPSLEILLSVLASPVPLSSQELVHILILVTRSPDAEDAENQRLLTNGDGEDGGDMETFQLVNGQATYQPSSPCSIPPGNKPYHRLLNNAMKRLHACPSSSVARALKREMSTSQLRILVDTLRMEIARSGWLSPYIESLETPDLDVQQNDSQMCFITHLLGCVIDSLGTGGWILGNSTSDDLAETADTIAYMKAEISAALEGIEEATYLKGMLGEMLLCGKDTLKSSVTHTGSTEVLLSALPSKPTSVALNADSQLLPLGLKPTPVVSTTKVGAGGELIKRSKRDIGRLKSKMVGKYSFDQIIV